MNLALAAVLFLLLVVGFALVASLSAMKVPVRSPPKCFGDYPINPEDEATRDCFRCRDNFHCQERQI